MIRIFSVMQIVVHIKMKMKTIITITALVLAAAFFLPLAIGIWVPDIVYAKKHIIAYAENSTGHTFSVIQYWNRCDFYNTELIHTTPDGKKQITVLDGDDNKSWQVPISVDEANEKVIIVLANNRKKIIYYGNAQQKTGTDK